jgi:hypothetical protein
MLLHMLLPLVMTLIIALPLYQVLKVVVAHLAIQYGLDLILILTVDESCGWGWCRTLARNGIWMRDRQFDHGEHGVKAAEVGRESKAICALADTHFNDKGAYTSVGQFRRRSVGSNITSI